MNPVFNFDENKFEELEGIYYLANNLIVAILERVMPAYNQYNKANEYLMLMESELNNVKDAMSDFGNTPGEMLSDASVELDDEMKNYIIKITNQNDETQTIKLEL